MKRLLPHSHVGEPGDETGPPKPHRGGRLCLFSIRNDVIDLLSEQPHPIRRAWGLFFGFVGLPLLVAIAWYNAPRFDPYSEIFFTRFYVEPSPKMPGEMRIMGWVFLGLGALLAVEPIVVAMFGRLKWRQVALMIWLGGWVAAFGGAFFVAADTAEVAIEQETGVETGQT